MTKYKLEYIWLDGYEPVPNLRGKTKIEEFDRFPELEELPLWGFDGSSTRQADGQQLRLHPEAGRALPRPRPDERRARDVRGAAPRRDPASEQQPGDDPGRPGHVVRLRAGVLLLRRRRSRSGSRRPASRRRRASTTPASATRTSARSRARSSRRTSISASRPGSTTRASTPRWRRASGSSRSSARARSGPPTRCGSPGTCCCGSASSYGVDVNWHCKPLGAEVDWNGSGMHTNFSTKYMREVGGKEYFHALMAAFERAHGGAHRGLRPGQPPAPDRSPRDAVDRHVQLGRRRPRRVDPGAAQLRQQRLQGLSRGSAAELPGRPVPDRRADHRVDRGRAAPGRVPGRAGGRKRLAASREQAAGRQRAGRWDSSTEA